MATLKEDLSRDLTNAEKLVFGAEAWVDKEGKIVERGIGNLFDRHKAAAAVSAPVPATVAPAPTTEVPAASVPVAPASAPVAVEAPVAAASAKDVIEEELAKLEKDIHTL